MLDIRLKAPTPSIVGVADIIAEARLFATDKHHGPFLYRGELSGLLSVYNLCRA